MRILAAAASVLLLASGLHAQERPEVVRLRDGSRIVGRIVPKECSNEVLVLKDIRTGALRRVPWTRIEEKTAQRLRIDLGFEVPESSNPSTIEGHRIRNTSGAVFEGLLVNPDTAKADGVYVLRTAEGPRRIPVRDVVEGPDKIELDASVVFTPVELYERRLEEKGPPESAEDHYRLAEFARTVGALEKAKEHYQAVLAGIEGSKYSVETIERRLKRVDKRLSMREAEDELREIQQAIVHKRWDRVSRLIGAFRTRYEGDADLLAEAADLEDQARERRADHFIRVIPRKLRNEVKDLLEDKVKEDEVSFRDARKYAGGQVSQESSVSAEAIVVLAKELGLEPAEVLDFWNRRSKTSVQKAFYRDGTFIVVDGLEDALAKAPKVKLPRSRRGAAAPKAPSPHPRRSADDWWEGKVKTKKYTDLRDFLYAFWAEESGMVELMEPKEDTCAVCHGKGYVSHTVQSSRGAIPFFDRCQNCYEATYWKIVRFK